MAAPKILKIILNQNVYQRIKNKITGNINEPIAWLLFTLTMFGIIPIAVATIKINSPIQEEK